MIRTRTRFRIQVLFKVGCFGPLPTSKAREPDSESRIQAGEEIEAAECCRAYRHALSDAVRARFHGRPGHVWYTASGLAG